MMEMGFPEDMCRAALEKAGGNLEAAVQGLFA